MTTLQTNPGYQVKPMWLTTQQAETLLQVNHRVLHRLRRERKIRAVQIGTHRNAPWRWLAKSLENLASNPPEDPV